MHKRKEIPLSGAAQPLQPLLLTIPEVAMLLGVRRTRVYSLIQREGLPSVSLGGRGGLRVVRASLELWIQSRETCGGALVRDVPCQIEAKTTSQQPTRKSKRIVRSSGARSEGNRKYERIYDRTYRCECV